MEFPAGAVVNLASGLLIAGLGISVLAANPRKDWNRVFALLAIFWGAQIVALNSVLVAQDGNQARLAGDVGLALLIPLYFFVVAFAALFPRPRGLWAARPGALLVLALPALAALVVLVVEPGILLGRVEEVSGGFSLRWGPLFAPLIVAPLYGAFLFALHAMARRLEDASSPIERRQVAFVLAALGLYVGYAAPRELLRFGAATLGLGTAQEAAGVEAASIAFVMLAGVGVLAQIAWRLAQRWHAGEAAIRFEARLALSCIALGAGAALLDWLLGLVGFPRPELLGLLRAGTVGLIVYAIARYQLFDIDLRVKQAAVGVAAVLAGAGFAAAGWLVLQRVNAPVLVGGGLAAILALAAIVPLVRVGARLADRVAPHVSREGDHLYLRKLEVYRAHVEAVLGEGRAPTTEDPVLADLREKLGLSGRDHGVVVSLAVARAAPGAAPDLRPGGSAFGKYAIESLLAEGSFGRVFLARDRVLERPVVIKELQARWRGNAGVVRTFLQEAQIAGQLNHPNIVAVHAVERHGEDYYVIMEHLPGGTLAQRLARGTMPEAEAVRVTASLLDALDAAHARGVVHRDVKPDNILFGPRGEVKIADFGIAQLGQEDAPRTISGLTEPAPHPGTLQYMSPEQARGKPLDARSDLYAVGAVLHRMVTGQHHVDLAGLDELAARGRISEAGPPAAMPGVSPLVGALLQRALATRPEDRFPSARAFAEALAAVKPAPGAARPA